MRFLVLFCILLISCLSDAQNSPEYYRLCEKGIQLYRKKEFKASAQTFSEAFKLNGWKGHSEDRYNAACSWSLAGYPDSAFFQLYRIATKGKFEDYRRVSEDPDLLSLHKDARWKSLLDTINSNKEKAEAGLDKRLVKLLENVLYTDQRYRQQIESYEEKYGYNSKETRDLWATIRKQDEANLKTVSYILDNFGWLGPEIIGSGGNSALFLVIQHSDQKTQEKYLPMMREAVKSGNAEGSDLALLEDRVAMRQGKKQIYGSQVEQAENGKYKLYPIEDEVHVNERRAKVGLEPIEQYVAHWNIAYKPGMSNLDNKPFFNRHPWLLVVITVFFFGSLTAILLWRWRGLMFSEGLWFSWALVALSLISWFYEVNNSTGYESGSIIKSLFCNLSYGFTIFTIILILYAIMFSLLRRKWWLFEMIAVAGGTSLFCLYGLRLIRGLYYPDSHTMIFFTILPVLVVVGLFPGVKLILWLLMRQKKLR